MVDGLLLPCNTRHAFAKRFTTKHCVITYRPQGRHADEIGRVWSSYCVFLMARQTARFRTSHARRSREMARHFAVNARGTTVPSISDWAARRSSGWTGRRGKIAHPCERSIVRIPDPLAWESNSCKKKERCKFKRSYIPGSKSKSFWRYFDVINVM